MRKIAIVGLLLGALFAAGLSVTEQPTAVAQEGCENYTFTPPIQCLSRPGGPTVEKRSCLCGRCDDTGFTSCQDDYHYDDCVAWAADRQEFVEIELYECILSGECKCGSY
jgi:hypothetical protein